MNWIDAIILGTLQGVTEFLPVSSSGHLVIAQKLLPWFHEPGILLDVMLHGGTLLSIFIYFRQDIISFTSIFKSNNGNKKREQRLLYLIIIATLPTGIIAVSFKDTFESLFNSIITVGAALIITGALLTLTILRKKPQREIENMGILDALLIGIFQGIAIIPGISRSGTTIAAAIYRDINAVAAARFSFLLSIPAIFGAIVLEIKGLGVLNSEQLWLYLLATLTASVSGYTAIASLMHLLENKRLKPFAYYCITLGAIVLLWGMAK